MLARITNDHLDIPDTDHIVRPEITPRCPTTIRARRLRTALATSLTLSTWALCSTVASGQTPSNPEPAQTQKANAESAGEIRLEGQITSSTGSGLSGVVVEVFAVKEDGTKGPTIARAKTDQFGDFHIRSKREIRGDVIVVMTKKSYATTEHRLHMEEREYPPFLAETLAGSLSLEGDVVSADDGKPITKAEVTLMSGYDENQTETDSQGHFSVTGLTQGRVQVIVEADKFGRETLDVERVEQTGKLKVQLKPERVLRFIVVNELDQPVDGATIECLDPPRNDFRTLVTDNQGAATVTGLHFDAKELSLRLTHPDYVSDTELSRQVTLPQKKLFSTQKLVLQRAGKVEAIITDEEGRPIYGARVLAGADNRESQPRDWTNEQGRCVISGVPAGTTAITAQIADYAPQLKTIHVTASQTTKVKLSLGPPAILAGHVKTEAGEPAANVEVMATKWRGYQTLGLRALTGPDGAFEMENAPHDEFEVTVLVRGSSDKPITVKAGTGIDVELKIAQAPSAGPPGIASSPKIGQPVPDVTLTSMDGQTFVLRDMKGKVIFLDFWATWCGPCVAELPGLIELHKKFAQRKDFVMVSISLDFDKATLRSFLKKKKDINWPQVFGEHSGANEASIRFGAEALPATFIVDANGNMAASWLRGEAIQNKVAELLAASNP